MLSSISKYEVMVSSHPRFNEWTANILLRKGEKLIVDVRFVEDPVFWAPHGSINEDGVSTIYTATSQFAQFVDILRNEKPIFVQLVPENGSLPPRMLLRTGQEPVGEQEISSLLT